MFDGGPWTLTAYQNRRWRIYAPAVAAAGVAHPRPYDPAPLVRVAPDRGGPQHRRETLIEWHGKTEIHRPTGIRPAPTDPFLRVDFDSDAYAASLRDERPRLLRPDAIVEVDDPMAANRQRSSWSSTGPAAST